MAYDILVEELIWYLFFILLEFLNAAKHMFLTGAL
jgi:hypothetical protein